MATNSAMNATRATRERTAVGVSFRRGRGSGSPSPEVCAESGGVEPGETPPPGSRAGVSAGSGSGGNAVESGTCFAYPRVRRSHPVSSQNKKMRRREYRDAASVER